MSDESSSIESKKDELIGELEGINEIEEQAKAKKMWLIGMFSGLFVTVVGLFLILGAHSGAIASHHTTTGFRVGVVGVVIYWGFRAVYIFKNKMKQNKKGYQRKHIDKGE